MKYGYNLEWEMEFIPSSDQYPHCYLKYDQEKNTLLFRKGLYFEITDENLESQLTDIRCKRQPVITGNRKTSS